VTFDNSTSKNFQYSTVAIAPQTPLSGLSLTVQPTDGLKFAEAPFWAVVCAPETQPLGTNAEVIRVTGKTGDKFTIERAQQGSVAQDIATGWTIFAGDSAASWAEVHEAIEEEIANRKTAVTAAETAATTALAGETAARKTAVTDAETQAAADVAIAKSEAEAAATSKVATETARAEIAEAEKLAKAENLKDVADVGSSRANVHVPMLTPVLAVATTNIALSGLQTIDGVTPGSGAEELKTVLLTAQTEAKNNGLWNQAAGAWTRPTEFAEGLAVKARAVIVVGGKEHAKSEWLLENTNSVTVGTTVQTWVERQPASVESGSAIEAGNLGASHTLTLTHQNVLMDGTLTANHTLTIAGFVQGSKIWLWLKQDATGGRTLTITEGTTPVVVPLNTEPNSITPLQLFSSDGVTLGVVSALTAPSEAWVVAPPSGSAATDTANIQAALNKANAKYNGVAKVLLRDAVAGSYVITEPLRVGEHTLFEGMGAGSLLNLQAGANCNVIQSVNYGSGTVCDDQLKIRNITIFGEKATQSATTCPETQLTATANLSASASTVEVVSTTGYAETGTIWVGPVRGTYTGKTATTFTGVTALETATVHLGASVMPVASQGHGVALQSSRSEVDNVWVHEPVGSGIYFQGQDRTVGLGFENRITGTCRGDYAGRYALEIGENIPDGHDWGMVMGPECQKAALLVRSYDWQIHSFHPTGANGGGRVLPAALVIANGGLKINGCHLDTFPDTGVIFDTQLRGQGEITDVDIDKIDWSNCGCGVAGGSPGVLFRGPGSQGLVQRIRMGVDMNSPVSWGFLNAPTTRTLGVQSTEAPTNGKIQVLNASSFAPSSALGGGNNVTIGSDTAITYTGRQMTLCVPSEGWSVGATSLKVKSTSGLEPSGIISVTVFNSASNTWTLMEVTYTGITGNEITGIPASGGGSLTTAGSAALNHAFIRQDFLTGVSGGHQSAAASNTIVIQGSLAVLNVEGLIVSEPIFNQLREPRMRMNAADTWSWSGVGLIGSKPTRSTGKLEVAIKGTSATATHNLGTTPTRWYVTPTSDTQSGLRWWATVTSTNITVTLSAETPTNAITFNWVCEVDE
jgi:hypothetical protein